MTVEVGQIPFRLVRIPGTLVRLNGKSMVQNITRAALLRLSCWSPAIALETDIATDLITIDNWKDIRVNGKASYSDGVISVSEFRALQGGEAEGSARISDRELRIDQLEQCESQTGWFDAHSSGTLNLKWRASD
jgi:hypothetical protein